MRGAAWTKEEEKVFAEIFPHCGAEGVHELLPHRSISAIEGRAHLHKVRRLPRDQRKTLAELRPSSPPPAPTGIPARYHPDLKPVPDSALGMPWVKYPKSIEDCKGVIARCGYVLDEFGVNMSSGEKAFFETSRRYAQAELANLERARAKQV